MRWAVLCAVLVVLTGTAWGQKIYVSEEEVGSDLIKDIVEQAADYLDKAKRAVQQTQFTAAEFAAKDTEFMLARALEFELPANHMAATQIGERLDKVRADIKD